MGINTPKSGRESFGKKFNRTVILLLLGVAIDGSINDAIGVERDVGARESRGVPTYMGKLIEDGEAAEYSLKKININLKELDEERARAKEGIKAAQDGKKNTLKKLGDLFK